MLIPLQRLVMYGRVRPGPVLHVGAHMGEEAEDYDRLGFAPVYWIEANQDLWAPLEKRLSPYGEQHVVPALVADKAREVTFNIANNGQSSSILPLGTHAWEHPEVKYVGHETRMATTVDTLLAEGKIQQAEFMNLDVQGAELDVLKGAKKFIRGVRTVYTEVNEQELYAGCALFPQITQFLNRQGFELYSYHMTPHHWGDAVYLRSPIIR